MIESHLSAMIAAIIAAMAILAAGSGSALAAPHTGEMFVTFIRHGESAGNASGLIDTSTPGPELTDKGRAEADAVAGHLADCTFDAIYASKMVRTQQTAKPTSDQCRRPVTVEPGIHEIEAGIYEGRPEHEAGRGYFEAPLQWIQGNLDARIPGSINGHEFKKRMDDSIQDIQNRGSKRPMIFSHGGAIMIWTLLSVADPDLSKLQNDPLQNTGRVVVKGTPEKGWRLVSWDGTPAG
ncbi:histidine phosphatase family protein [Nocardia speluncae]|nr:histidine phosphatase family protein [Nocardia speluncae]